MKLSEIAEEINSYLKEFENKQVKRGEGLTKYYQAYSCSSGKFVYVTYVSYQKQCHLSKEEAEIYLKWLQAGNEGKHWKALEESKIKKEL